MNNEKSHSTRIPSAKEFIAERGKRRAMVKRYKSTNLLGKIGYEINLCKYTVTLSQIRSVVAQLRVKGKVYPSFVKICFDTQVVINGQSENTIDLQYSKEDGVIGFEWLLLSSRNKADKKHLIKFITQLGHKFTERLMNNVHYLRIEGGDIVGLGYRIATELYQLGHNAEISLFVNGFEYRPNLTLADVMRFVRLSAGQQGFIVDVEKISAVLRLIHGKRTVRHPSYAVFRTFLGFIRFSDMISDNLDHKFLSVIHTVPRTNKLEEDLLGKSGINLLSACGYQHACGKEYFQKWFSGTTDHDFREMAEFCVGILHLLFDHQPGYPLEIELCTSGPNLKKLPKWGELPEPMQAPYCSFKMRFHRAMAKFHTLMTIESPTLSQPQISSLIEVSTEMENVLEEFPSWITKLQELGPSFTYFHSFATDNQTELIEGLNVLRRHYSDQIVH